MTHWLGVDNWTITVPLISGQLHVQREGRDIRVESSLGGTFAEAQLTNPPSAVDERADIRRAYQAAADQYPRFMALHVLSPQGDSCATGTSIDPGNRLLFLHRLEVRHYFGLRVLNSLCWIGGGAWLLTRYLV